MANQGTMKVATQGDREIVITRVFDAPRHLVWNAYTQPELVRRWLLGPPGWTMPVCEIDLRVGGKYRYVWRNDAGAEMGMEGVHREVVPPERIVCTQLFDEDWTGGEAVGTLVLTEQGGRTTVTNTILYSSKEARDGALQSGMEQGMAAGYDRLEELLTTKLSLPTGLRQTGEFCWINMLTPQPDQAREFFGKLLGWTYFEMPGIGHGIQVGGRDIGGLFDLHSGKTPAGLPPLIGVMVKVDNADATCAKVQSLGGTHKPPFDIADNLRMAVCFDSNGANFDVWEPKQGHGTDVDSSLHGAPSWFETLTTEVSRATQFYCELFGWTAQDAPLPGGKSYTTFKLGGTPVAGMMQIAPEMGAMPPHWGTYFTVTDIDATMRLAVELGAKVCLPTMEVAGVGRMGGLSSPQGVMFYVIQYLR
jgi:predicted enzyme related to lactoylglutathione lyase/uncharacterized protein YndB with AHSA1/START domain